MIDGCGNGCADQVRNDPAREHGGLASSPSTGDDAPFTPIGAIVNEICVTMARSRPFEAWREHESDLTLIPHPSLFAACRAEGASDELIVRLIHRLSAEKKLKGYAQDGGLPFLNLCRHFVRKDAA